MGSHHKSEGSFSRISIKDQKKRSSPQIEEIFAEFYVQKRGFFLSKSRCPLLNIQWPPVENRSTKAYFEYHCMKALIGE